MCLILYVFYAVPVVAVEWMFGRECSMSDITRLQQYMFGLSPKAKIYSASEQNLHLMLTWITLIKPG